MKLLILSSLLLILSSSLISQTIEKSKIKPQSYYQNKNDLKKPDQIFNFRSHERRENKNFTNHSMNKLYNRLNSSYLEEPVQFPFIAAYELVPLVLSDSVLAFFWGNQDSLLFSTSLDTGKTWANPITIGTNIYASYLTGIITDSGRILLSWLEYIDATVKLRIAYSDDLLNWNINTLSQFNYAYAPKLSKTNDGKLWLFYSKYYDATWNDLFYVISADNGKNWSKEKLFSNDSGDEFDCIVVSNSNSDIIAFYDNYIFNQNWNEDIFKKISIDGGLTWGDAVPVLESDQHEYLPEVLTDSSGLMWLIFSFTSVSSNFPQSDVCYTKSTDGGNTWDVPTPFTQYAGYDGGLHALLFNDQPFVVFTSTRWMLFENDYTTWYGVIGITKDNNPPPAFLNLLTETVGKNLSFNLQAYVADETGISEVKAEINLNGINQGIIQLRDDGLHNDSSADDNIWGTAIGPFESAKPEDSVKIYLSITDNSNNSISVLPYSGIFEIPAIHNSGNIVLSFNNNSQLSEYWTSGISAHWPKENGNDYLAYGGLWIGAEISGTKRVMNLDFYENDWQKVENTYINIAPGISDQDADLYYEDFLAAERIGLEVHQKSYQWSNPTRDDFIIIEYSVKNKSAIKLDNILAALWLDPDIPRENSFDDLGGYDSSRGMIYQYDSQNNPAGYFGTRLLNGKPQTAKNSTNDPTLDISRYNFMTTGIYHPNSTPADYRMIITAQPFTLAPGDFNTVAFGIVLGNGLSELQINSDTMETIYKGITVGLPEEDKNSVPVSYFLAQNYPNPFNPTTKISYAIPKKSFVTIKIFDVLGKEVFQLVNQEKSAGKYEAGFDASAFSTRVYFYKIQAGDFVETKKMILLK